MKYRNQQSYIHNTNYTVKNNLKRPMHGEQSSDIRNEWILLTYQAMQEKSMP
jgi:hypothetical protein